MDDDGQILEGHSISAGLDYPGIGPEHAGCATPAGSPISLPPTPRRLPPSALLATRGHHSGARAGPCAGPRHGTRTKEVARSYDGDEYVRARRQGYFCGGRTSWPRRRGKTGQNEIIQEGSVTELSSHKINRRAFVGGVAAATFAAPGNRACAGQESEDRRASAALRFFRAGRDRAAIAARSLLRKCLPTSVTKSSSSISTRNRMSILPARRPKRRSMKV